MNANDLYEGFDLEGVQPRETTRVQRVVNDIVRQGDRSNAYSEMLAHPDELRDAQGYVPGYGMVSAYSLLTSYAVNTHDLSILHSMGYYILREDENFVNQNLHVVDTQRRVNDNAEKFKRSLGA
jgi:hypothetical protein